MNTSIAIGAIALVIGFGAGYVAHSAPSTTPQSAIQAGFRMNGSTTRTPGAGGFLTGTVASKDAGSITLNTRDGNSRVVIVGPATTVSKSVNGTLSDVSVGSSVIVTGPTNGDGSVSASFIQLRPAFPESTQPTGPQN